MKSALLQLFQVVYDYILLQKMGKCNFFSCLHNLVETCLKLRQVSTTPHRPGNAYAPWAVGGGDFRQGRKSIARWDAFRQLPPSKIKGGGQAPLGLARLDNRRARPGGAVNGGALVRRSS